MRRAFIAGHVSLAVAIIASLLAFVWGQGTSWLWTALILLIPVVIWGTLHHDWESKRVTREMRQFAGDTWRQDP